MEVDTHTNITKSSLTMKQKQFSVKGLKFSKTGARTIWTSIQKNLNKELTVFTKKDSKWVRDLNINLKMIKLLEDNIREMIGTVDFRYNTKRIILERK